MCGILYCKLKSNKNTRNFQEAFGNALDLMNYRGPDAKDIEIIDNHYFGHVRLSIVDLHCSSNQPYQDEDNLMIYNGEIYNFKEIDPSSNSDTKTLFHCMKTMEDPFKKIRGMFAFGWFDKKNNSISFYRDFFGEKPLYYYSDESIDVVSSTIKSIAYLIKATGKGVKLNLTSIKDDYLLFGYIREPKTIWEDILAVPPGHRLSIINGKCQVESLLFDPKALNHQWEESTYIKNALASTDVPGTLLLSGGIDSTFLLANAIKHKIALRLGIYKANDSRIDESTKAMDNISKMKLEASQFPVSILSSHEIASLDIDSFVKLLEQPSSAGLQVFHLLKHLRDQDPDLKLVYTGLGGDELFGGYPTFYNYKKINFLIKIPFIENLLPAIKRFKKGREILKKWDPNVYSFLYRLNYKMFANLYQDEEKLNKIYANYIKSLDSIPNELLSVQYNKSSFMIKKNETFQYGTNQLLRDNDNIAMYLGFESRSPLLNLDWYSQMPDKKLKLTNSLRNKYGINFGKKKGFTLDEPIHKNVYWEYINTNLDFYETIMSIKEIQLEKTSVAELRAIAILGGWLRYNIN